jgi:hypothetical protein
MENASSFASETRLVAASSNEQHVSKDGRLWPVAKDGRLWPVANDGRLWPVTRQNVTYVCIPIAIHINF